MIKLMKSHWSISLLTFLQGVILSESVRVCVRVAYVCVCVWGGGGLRGWIFTIIYEDMKILKAAVIMLNQYMQYNVYTFAYHLCDKHSVLPWRSVIVVM